MKKRILLLACALALLVGCLVMTSMAATTKTGYCEACKETVTWEPIVFGTQTGEIGEHRHYYLDKDYTHTGNKQLNVKGNSMTLCLDLNGKSWYSYGRAFYANYNTKNEDWSTINIQDSVGGAVVTARAEAWLKADGTVTGTNNTGGANIWVAEKCTVNIYGGTFKLDAIESQQGLRVDNGGIASVCAGGTLNVYGGTLQGGKIKGTGAAVYLYDNGKLNVYGGSIRSGNSLNNTGSCVGLRSGSKNIVTLSGDASIDDIYLQTVNPEQLLVSGAFTGKANITYKTGVPVEEGKVIGKLVNSGSVADGDLYCTSGYRVAADGTSLKLAEPSVEEVRYECPHCKIVVKWDSYPNTSVTAAGTYHYYLDKNYDTATAKQFSVKAGAQVCLDLMGHSYDTIGRVCGTSESGSVLSIMDTVGGGKMTAHGGNNNPGGGTVSVGGSSTFNLYSGTLAFEHTPENSPTWGGTGRGGVIQNSGTVNIYGGKIQGGEVVDCTYEFTGIEGAGGAIYNNGTLNIQGGEITMGVAADVGAGPCIYVAGASNTVTLGGNAKVADIYFAALNASRFSIDGKFTGTAQLSFEAAVTLHQGLVVGKCAATDWQGTISCNSESFPSAIPVDGELVLSAYPAGTVAGTGGEGYLSLQEAVDAAQEGATIDLMSSVTGDITVNKNITLQLNGCDVKGTVTVAEGKTLYGMDSSTADYTVADGKYGTITQVVGNVAGAVDGSDSYLTITESNGVSFHCVTLQIYAMTLRTTSEDEPGLYYKSHFKADEKAAPMIATYGVALSLVGAPDADNMGILGSYTEFTGFESGPLGNLGNTSSSLLKGILKNSYTDAVNAENLESQIYGRAYAKTTDGQVLMGAAVSRSLLEQLQGVDGMMDGLSSVQTKIVTDLYAQFKPMLQDKALANIAAAWENNEKGTLKVLVLGNSHGLDATNLLAEVFYQERVAGNHDQDVLIAALYYSGCTVSQHHSFLSGNQKVYTYHKNYATTAGEKWVVKDATCLDALQDEQWDVILMQQMNTNAARESYYKEGDWKYVADYLLNNQDNTPTLGFHMTWANPDDYELYLNDDAPYKIKTGNHASWRTNHETTFPGADGKYDQTVMYNKIMELTQKYLVDSTDWLGKDYFDERYIMNSATAVHYAQNVRGRTHEHIYRDYTHMNDYGRLICAYQWYAQLMGLEELTEVNTDAIPANLKHKNSRFPSATDANGDYIVDEQMKADLIASVNWTLKNPFHLPE